MVLEKDEEQIAAQKRLAMTDRRQIAAQQKLAMTDRRQIAAQQKLAMTDSIQIATQKRLAMTDSIQIAIPCFAGTGATEARDDGIKDRSPRKRGLQRNPTYDPPFQICPTGYLLSRITSQHCESI